MEYGALWHPNLGCAPAGLEVHPQAEQGYLQPMYLHGLMSMGN
jgi:hypothetical protein